MDNAIASVDWFFDALLSIYNFMAGEVFILQVVLGLLFLPKIVDFFRRLIGG